MLVRRSCLSLSAAEAAKVGWQLNMMFLGRIEPVSASSPIDPDKWLALIDSHDSLVHMPSRVGINPFTREPWEYKGSPSTGIIQKGGTKIGSIWWAMDGSPFLIVQAEHDLAEAVAGIAEEIAIILGARFVQEDPIM